MKVLIVCSGNTPNAEQFDLKIHQVFIYEQVEMLKLLGIEFDYFFIHGKGLLGYIKNYPALIKKLKHFKPDLIHAHYGFSGLLACLQRKVKVITTYHGSDINPFDKIGHSIVKRINIFTYLSLRFSYHNIFASVELLQITNQPKKSSVISCGVDLENFYEMNKEECRLKFQFIPNKNYILFSSSFNNPIKNYDLAKEVIDMLNDSVLIELKGYSRKEVALLMNACDVLLVTSKNESGPLVVKEAMACNCPIVSTDVGDVREIMENINGCYITNFDPIVIVEKLNLALSFSREIGHTTGRKRIIEMRLENAIVAKKVLNVYEKAIMHS
jgi:teichuronic acid biosynthesis glycosyltransferase TuaC